VFSIRTLVAAKELEINKAIIVRIVRILDFGDALQFSSFQREGFCLFYGEVYDFMLFSLVPV
jgi:hypothetical protein